MGRVDTITTSSCDDSLSLLLVLDTFTIHIHLHRYPYILHSNHGKYMRNFPCLHLDPIWEVYKQGLGLAAHLKKVLAGDRLWSAGSKMCTGCRMMPLAWWQLQGRDQGTTHVMGTPATADTAATRHWLGYKLRDISILTLSSSRLSRVLGYPEQSPNGLYQYQYLDKLACEEMKWTAQLKSLQKNLHGFLVTQ